MAIPTKKRKTENLNGVPGRDADSTCIISSGTRLEGNLFSRESIRMDGAIEGDLRCERKLVLGSQGRITGNVEVGEAVIMGRITGNVRVKGLLHLTESGAITGDVQSGILHIEQGATFEGNSKIVTGS
jgi:cytoskeletal protein CcmA (bactofilin family)